MEIVPSKKPEHMAPPETEAEAVVPVVDPTLPETIVPQNTEAHESADGLEIAERLKAIGNTALRGAGEALSERGVVGRKLGKFILKRTGESATTSTEEVVSVTSAPETESTATPSAKTPTRRSIVASVLKESGKEKLENAGRNLKLAGRVAKTASKKTAVKSKELVKKGKEKFDEKKRENGQKRLKSTADTQAKYTKKAEESQKKKLKKDQEKKARQESKRAESELRVESVSLGRRKKVARSVGKLALEHNDKVVGKRRIAKVVKLKTESVNSLRHAGIDRYSLLSPEYVVRGAQSRKLKALHQEGRNMVKDGIVADARQFGAMSEKLEEGKPLSDKESRRTVELMQWQIGGLQSRLSIMLPAERMKSEKEIQTLTAAIQAVRSGTLDAETSRKLRSVVSKESARLRGKIEAHNRKVLEATNPDFEHAASVETRKVQQSDKDKLASIEADRLWREELARTPEDRAFEAERNQYGWLAGIRKEYLTPGHEDIDQDARNAVQKSVAGILIAEDFRSILSQGVNQLDDINPDISNAAKARFSSELARKFGEYQSYIQEKMSAAADEGRVYVPEAFDAHTELLQDLINRYIFSKHYDKMGIKELKLDEGQRLAAFLQLLDVDDRTFAERKERVRQESAKQRRGKRDERVVSTSGRPELRLVDDEEESDS